jgi:hypothetical protein
MLSRRIAVTFARVLTGVLLGSLLAVPMTSTPAHAGTGILHDNSDYDVPHRDIDMAKLKVTYDAKGVRATITMDNLRETKRIRIFVGMVTRADDNDPISPEFGNFVEFRLNERGKQKVVGWVAALANDDYVKEKCSGVKVKANYKRDTLKYKMPNRCARFDLARGYVDTWASARKFNPGTWDEGSPSLTTGDWFDTTYDLVVLR